MISFVQGCLTPDPLNFFLAHHHNTSPQVLFPTSESQHTSFTLTMPNTCPHMVKVSITLHIPSSLTPGIIYANFQVLKVRKALKLRRNIVTLDWLRDSMHMCKCVPEEPFSHVAAVKKQREREKRRARLQNGLEEEKRAVNTSEFSFALFIQGG